MSDQIDPSILTPRLVSRLSSNVSPAASTPVRVLIKFDTDDALTEFVDKSDEISALASGGTPEEKLKVVRVLRSIRTAAVEIRVDVLGNLTALATTVGIQTIDEDYRVSAFLDEVLVCEKVEVARQEGLRGEGIRIAILDTGIDDTHKDLEGIVSKHLNYTAEGPEDGVGHGTHVASIVAGRGIEDASKRGVADLATLIDVKVLASDGQGSASDVIHGIEESIRLSPKVDIINMSLGAAGVFDGTDPLSEASDWAVSQGVVVCAAAGNCGPAGNPLSCGLQLGEKTIGTPGCAKDVITVGAVDKNKQIAGYSSRGPTWGGLVKPDVVTVGSAIVAARAKNTDMGTDLAALGEHYTQASGTSMATPVCAGLVALVLEAARAQGQDIDPKGVKNLLRAAAAPITDLAENVQGKGFIDAQALFAGETVSEDLFIEKFEPESGKQPVVGTRETWLLALKNAGSSAVFDVRVTFSPHDNVVIEPLSSSFGTLEANDSERVPFSVEASEAGTITLDLKLEYRLASARSASIKEQTLSLDIDVKALGVAVSLNDVNSVLDNAVHQLLQRQKEDGVWSGDIMFNAWTNGMFCILHRLLGLEKEPTQALDWLENHRSGLDAHGDSDGTWGIIDDPSLHFLEASIASEIALEIWGRGRNPEVWDFINGQATARLARALSLVDPFTQVFAALASDYAPSGTAPYYAMSDVLAPPIELLLAPSFLPFNLARLAGTWGQDALTALMVITTVKAGKPVSLAKKVLLKKAEVALLRTQNEDGSWYATVLPSVAATLAMHLLGYNNDHPVMRKAVDFLQKLQRPDGYVQRYRLPVWDTCLAAFALRTAGLPASHPQLRKAGYYLLDSSRAVDGGIPFQKENVPWPDTDDTAFGIIVLDDLDLGEREQEKEATIASGLRWLLFMQGRDGGWAAFAKDQARAVKGRIALFKDDPPTADVTGHVLSAMKLAPQVGGEVAAARDAIKRGIDWIRKQQLSDGQWFGRWGLTYTYGTTAILQGLYDIGEDMGQEVVTRGVQYLLSTQQADGGWGEGFMTYYDFQAREQVTSTVDQTAWSVLGLLVAPQAEPVRIAVDRGIQFLLNAYDAQNGWPEDRYTVGALWVYKNSVYPLVWGVWALALYVKTRTGE